MVLTMKTPKTYRKEKAMVARVSARREAWLPSMEKPTVSGKARIIKPLVLDDGKKHLLVVVQSHDSARHIQVDELHVAYTDVARGVVSSLIYLNFNEW